MARGASSSEQVASTYSATHYQLLGRSTSPPAHYTGGAPRASTARARCTPLSARASGPRRPRPTALHAPRWAAAPPRRPAKYGVHRRRVSSEVAGSRAKRWRGHEGTARYRRRGCESPRLQRCQRSERTAAGTPCPTPRPPPAPPRARQGYDAPSRSIGRLRRCWSRRQTCAQVARGM